MRLMRCPQKTCIGTVEAKAPFWLSLTEEGEVSLYAIGWHESGEIACTEGGEDHISRALRDSLADRLHDFCATAEALLEADAGEKYTATTRSDRQRKAIA